MEATQNLHWGLKGKASRKGREGNKVKWTLALRYHETGGDRGLYLANLYRGGRGGPVAFLSGPTTSAASHHHRPSSPVSCLLQTSGRGHSCPGFPTWKPLGLLLPREPPSSPLPPRLGPRPTLCLSIPGQPPVASPSSKQHLPQTHSLSRQNTGRPPAPGLSPSRALSGPESGSAEVPGPGTPALSREAQPQSPTALPGWTISGRTGEEEPKDVQISEAISRWDRWDL